jgi:phosphate starvation-inducible PhoH-like protein
MFLYKNLARSYSCTGKRFISMRAKVGSKKGSESALSPLYKPKGNNQENYSKLLGDPQVSILLAVGPAGTGKTLFACNTAVDMLSRGEVQKIILTRPMISVEDEEIGFLPGGLVSKMDPWTRPIFDILGEKYGKRDIDAMLQSGALEIAPLAFMRGRTFKRAFIIADEMQNSSPNQMMMLATRLGEGSRMVITGDLNQTDRADRNGLVDFMGRVLGCDDLENIRVVEFGVQDVMRSPVVETVLKLYSLPGGGGGGGGPSPAPFINTNTFMHEKDKKTRIDFNTTIPANNSTVGVGFAFVEKKSRPKKKRKMVDNDCAMIPDDPLFR